MTDTAFLLLSFTLLLLSLTHSTQLNSLAGRSRWPRIKKKKKKKKKTELHTHPEIHEIQKKVSAISFFFFIETHHFFEKGGFFFFLVQRCRRTDVLDVFIK